jgi:arginase
MNKIVVIGVPSSAGARRVGQERAPQSFRQAGFIEGLRTAGLEVVDVGDLDQVSFRPDTENPREQNLSLVRDVAERVAAQVSRAFQQQSKPIVLGGDCTITLGVLAGMIRHRPSLGLMYFDGDVDLNTPETTLSGIFDGMGMSHITGGGADALTHIGGRYPLMPEENIVLFGYNPQAGWMDAAEVQRLEECSMMKYPVTQIRGRAGEAAAEALARLEARVSQVLVHFDVDVIDARDFPAADVLHDHGLAFDEAIDVLRVSVSSPSFAGLVITEFNPDRDRDGALATKLVEGVKKIIAGSHPSWGSAFGKDW